MFARGDIAECVENPGQHAQVTVGQEYVVIEAMKSEYGWPYIKILGNDNCGVSFYATMFRKK
jgi:hypothetical protein